MAVMALNEADTGWVMGVNMAKIRQTYRTRHSQPGLRQPVFHWTTPDMCAELLNFEVDVMNALQIKAHELSE